jgi:hypothetical protein
LFMSKQLLLSTVVILLLLTLCYPSSAQASSKIDVELQAVLDKSPPSELISIIVIFKDKPAEDQINILKTVHKMEITYVYRIINGVAGKAPAEEIPKIAEYEWVKEVWLDKRVYAMPDKAINTSELIERLQKENITVTITVTQPTTVTTTITSTLTQPTTVTSTQTEARTVTQTTTLTTTAIKEVPVDTTSYIAAIIALIIIIIILATLLIRRRRT